MEVATLLSGRETLSNAWQRGGVGSTSATPLGKHKQHLFAPRSRPLPGALLAMAIFIAGYQLD